MTIIFSNNLLYLNSFNQLRFPACLLHPFYPQSNIWWALTLLCLTLHWLLWLKSWRHLRNWRICLYLQVFFSAMSSLLDVRALRYISKLTTWFNFWDSYYVWKYSFLLHLKASLESCVIFRWLSKCIHKVTLNYLC